MKKILFVAVLLLGLACVNNAQAQKVAVKTNLLYDATATMNLGVEFGIAPKWTIDIEGNYNPFTWSKGRRWKSLFVQPEVRYWTCNRFAGHFFALQAFAGKADFKFQHLGKWFTRKYDFVKGANFETFKNSRLIGKFIGGGLGYGYDWAIAKHWNIEFEIAVGYAYIVADRYIPNPIVRYDEEWKKWDKGRMLRVAHDHKSHYVGPTKAAISLVYVF